MDSLTQHEHSTAAPQHLRPCCYRSPSQGSRQAGVRTARDCYPQQGHQSVVCRLFSGPLGSESRGRWRSSGTDEVDCGASHACEVGG